MSKLNSTEDEFCDDAESDRKILEMEKEMEEYTWIKGYTTKNGRQVEAHFRRKVK
tara:strand:- start:2 stop:166 length:165 start_codon:yes stop_codon:yes gene_type:complete